VKQDACHKRCVVVGKGDRVRWSNIAEGNATEYASGVLERLLIEVLAKGALQMMTGVRVK